MKTTIFKSAICMGVLLTGFTYCNSPEKKVEEAKEDVMEANRELEEARRDSVEYVMYRDEMEIKLQEYERKLDEMNDGLKSVGKDAKEKYEENLRALRQKNEEMKSKIREYKREVAAGWDSFKVDFNREMDELGESISETAEKNIKKVEKKK